MTARAVPDTQAKPLRFQDYERLVHKLTRRLCGWARARDRRGVTVSYEDLFQDLSMIWVQCRDRFDPTMGVQFSTYFMRAALNHWTQLSGQVDRSNATVSFSDPIDLDENLSLEEIISDPAALTPEQTLSRREWATQSLNTNPLLAKLAELSVNPPQELKAELMALAAQRVWAQELGVNMDQVLPLAFTPTLLGRAFRFNWRHRQAMQPRIAEGFI